MINSVLGAIASDMAIDLGTANTLIWTAGKGLVCHEPSEVAIRTDSRGDRKVLAYGRRARAMVGRTPSNIQVVRPLADGAIADFEVAEAVLRHMMLLAQGRRLWLGPRVAVCVPYGITEVEQRAMKDAVESAGAREVVMVQQPLAAALGTGLPVEQPCGHMVVDVGAGTTEIAVVSLGGIVYSRALKIGGDQLDRAIIRHIQESEELLIGPQSAEALKIAIGSAVPVRGQEPVAAVRGRDLSSGFPRQVLIGAPQVREAMKDPIQIIIEAVIASLEHTPPDLAADIAETGIVMTGGSAQLLRLDQVLRDATGLPVIVPEDPETTVVFGSARYLASRPDSRRATGRAIAG